MKLTDICRESVPIIEFDEPMSTLASEAQEVLGYSILKKEQEGPNSTLLSRLAAIQIDILKRSDVEQYKSEQLKERTQEKLSKWIAGGADTQFFGPGWASVEIGKYAQPIPEFVLNKAIQIKREIPEAVILIESLEDYPDPFLVVAIKDPRYSCLFAETHYVEVWAEPKFEGRIR